MIDMRVDETVKVERGNNHETDLITDESDQGQETEMTGGIGEVDLVIQEM